MSDFSSNSISSSTLKKKPSISVILSIIVPGVGQMYCGETVRGITFLIGTYLGLVLIIPGIALWLWSVFDAYRLTIKINEHKKDDGQVEKYKCVGCGQFKKHLHPFKFHIGKKIGEKYDYNNTTGQASAVTTSFSIEPDPISIKICENCIQNERLKGFLKSTLIFIPIIVLLGFASTQDPSMAIALFFWSIIYIIVVIVKFVKPQEKVVKKMIKKTYKIKGYDKIFTKSEYAGLHKTVN